MVALVRIMRENSLEMIDENKEKGGWDKRKNPCDAGRRPDSP